MIINGTAGWVRLGWGEKWRSWVVVACTSGVDARRKKPAQANLNGLRCTVVLEATGAGQVPECSPRRLGVYSQEHQGSAVELHVVLVGGQYRARSGVRGGG